MREFELIIDEALKIGLSPLLVTPTNSQLLKKCLGFRVGRSGLRVYQEKSNPLPAALSLSYIWPFPQFIAGDAYNLLIVRTSTGDNVYTVSDDHQTVTLAASIASATYGQGTLMEVADFGEYLFMTNGVVMIYWNVVTSSWTLITTSSVVPMMKAICNFKGQIVGGNIVSTWHDCDETFYVWSKIGQMNFTPDNYNLAGYRRDPHGGEVYHTMRLGDNVIGYSSEGITLISPVSSPAATFGFTELDNVGLINKGAVSGDLNRQVYLGEDYILREVTRQGIKELGYEYFMKQLAGEDIIITYDKKYKDFYIGNSEKTFLLSPNGMTEIPQHPSAVWRRNNETYMLPDSVDNFEYTIGTWPFDMQFAGNKTVFSIESDLQYRDNPRVAVDYYNNPNEFSTTLYKPLNNQNIGGPIISGSMLGFNLKFKAICNADPQISYIKVRYKMTDLRGLRGVYAPPIRGQG